MSSEQARSLASGYPVNLILQGRNVVVVGGGRIAARKVEQLLEVGAKVHVVAPFVTERIVASEQLAKSNLRISVRVFEPTDLDGTWLAVAATDDPEVNQAVFFAGEERRVWVNAADDPANCSVTLMSVVRRGDLQVAIGTGGRSPALATWLKGRFQAELGPEYSTLLEMLSQEREQMRDGGRSSEDADWQQALNSGILELIRTGNIDEAKERLRRCLTSSSV